jgi:hypothetical protein
MALTSRQNNSSAEVEKNSLRWYKATFVLLILCSVLVACQSCPTPSQPKITLIGQSDHTSVAANLLGAGGLKTQQTTTLAPTDVVLFVVSLLDGPMPQTREQIAAISGQPHGQAAIFLVKAKEQPDLELRQLVLLEVKDLLTKNGQPNVATMSVLYDDDPNILLTVRGLLEAP